MLKRKLIPLVMAGVMLVSFTLEPMALANVSKPAVFELIVEDVPLEQPVVLVPPQNPEPSITVEDIELEQPVVTVPDKDEQPEEKVPEKKVEKKQKKQSKKNVKTEYSKVKKEVKKETTKVKKSKKNKGVSGLSEEDIDLIALVTMAEAENQSELGKRLVIDVILNRIESKRFANTAHGVIYAKGQFTSMWNGRSDRCYVKKSIRKLVKEEIESRTNTEVLYFRSGRYHGFGTPVCKEDDHYFSTY